MPVGSLLAGYLDNVSLERENPAHVREMIKETLTYLKYILRPIRPAVLDVPILLVSSDSENIRFTQAMDPISWELSSIGIRSTHLSATDVAKKMRIRDMVYAGFLCLTHFLKVFKINRILRRDFGFTAGRRVALLIHLFGQIASCLSAQRILRSGKFKFVLLDWDRGQFQALFAVAARLAGLPNATLVHGTIGIPSKFVPIIANECWCWGTIHVDFFKEFGEQEEQLKIVGFPGLKKVYPKEELNVREYFHFEDKMVLTFAEQRMVTLDIYEVKAELQHCMSQLDEIWVLLIKPHPSQSYEFLNELFSGNDRIRVAPHHFRTPSILQSSDIVLVVDSTFCLDSIVAGVPTVFFNPSGRGVFGLVKDFADYGEAHVFVTGDELSRFLSKIPPGLIAEKTNLKKMQTVGHQLCQFEDEESARLIVQKIIESIN